MAGASLRLGKIFLRTSSRRGIISRELSGSVTSGLGDSCEAGSIRRADIAPNCQHLTAWWTAGACVPVLPGAKYALTASGGRPPPQTIAHGRLGFSRMCTETASPPLRRRQAIIRKAADGSEKVVARIANMPKFVFKNDLLSLLKGCNLTPEDVLYVYDAKYRLTFIELQMPSIVSYQLAQRVISSKGRFGGRYMKLTSENFEMDDVNKILAPFRGRSLLMVIVHFSTSFEEVELFFSGYLLDCSHPIKFIKSIVEVPVGGKEGFAPKLRTELRALVRFRTELEALRALREKQGGICVDRPIDLRFIS